MLKNKLFHRMESKGEGGGQFFVQTNFFFCKKRGVSRGEVFRGKFYQFFFPKTWVNF